MAEFVLGHGTTQSPAGWDLLASELRGRGHGVIAVDLPPGETEWTVADYGEHAARQTGQSRVSRVVVGHSGAGVLLPSIAEAVDASAAVWLAAYVPDFSTGQSMLDEIKAHREEMFSPDWIGVDPTSDPQLALRFLFHDCDQGVRQWALGTLRLFNPGPAVYQHAPAPLPETIVRASIVPGSDRTLRPEWMRLATRQRLGIEPSEIDASHCPHVSRPAGVADILSGLL